MYAALVGQDGSDAGAPLQAELSVMQQAPIGRASGLDQQLEQQRSSASSNYQMLPSITELKDQAAALQVTTTTTPESRVEALNRNLKTTPTPTATPRDCVASAVAAYCIYTVKEGDTLSTIAEEFDLGNDDLPGWDLLIASNKPDIVSADDFIQPGQKLRVPTANGIVHTVILDETIGDLADMFDVTSQAIVRANNLLDPDLIGNGQVLLIPDPKRLAAPKTEALPADPDPTATDPTATNSPESAPTRGQQPSAPEAEPKPEPEPTAEPVRGFIWPIQASVRITNYFSARHPLGIDLGLGHAPGSPVVAVAAGKVTFAGGDPCCSYGYYVIVDHENGLKTLYAHLRSINVSVGQRVSQGQVLGPSGSTGYSTGVHLHFEVHKNGTRVDPIPYLPR